MRYLRAAGIIISLGALLCGMAMSMDSFCAAAIWICISAMAICFCECPPERAALLAPAVCFAFAGAALMAEQTGTFLRIPDGAGDVLLPAGESAFRTLAGCILAVLIGAWLGETSLEGVLGRTAFANRAGYSGAPVRVCAFLCLLCGMATCAAPFLAEYVSLPESARNVLSLIAALSTGALACYIASARSNVAAVLALLLYIACAVFDEALFANHLFFAAVYSVLLCARADGRRAILCIVPVPAVLALLYFYRVDGSALSLYVQRLYQACVDFFQPGGLTWCLRLYARFGVGGYVVVGALSGALLFLLGRLLRDSFLYAAPVMFALAGLSLVLFKGMEHAPTLSDCVFFCIVYGLCLIVGCIRRASGRGKRRR